MPEVRLVVLDTLAGVRPIRTQQGYSEDYEGLATLHRLANECGVAVLVLHHTRKMEAEDPVDTVSGTLGLAGACDTILVLARNAKGTTLYLRGRDIEEGEHAVEFNRESCRWTILGEAIEVHRSEERKRVVDALRDGEAGTRGNLEKLLHFMVKDGEAVRIKRGVYGPGGDPR